MLVTQECFPSVLSRLREEPILVIDTETTGLDAWLGDRLFSIIVGTLGGEAYYFNFNPREDFGLSEILSTTFQLPAMRELFQDPEKRLVMHNAKFDMAMLRREGVKFGAEIYDTEVMARLQYNDHMRYTLADCGRRIGVEKSDAVELYIKEHKLYRKDPTPGMAKKKTVKFFDRVPKDVIVPYGEKDAVVTGALYQNQWGGFSDREKALAKMEMAFTKVLFDIECAGIKIDRAYCQKAFAHEHECYTEAARQFEIETGEPLVDSGKALAKILHAAGVELPLTDKGNFQVAESVLVTLTHPIAKLVLQYREHHKKAHTYYQNLLVMADKGDIIHPDFKQAGARTGRLSCQRPNLQNVPKEEDETSASIYRIRRAFVPREGYFFAEIDYKAMEFRVMLDYAGQRDLITGIQGGLDPHQVTADLVGISRRAAKTLNFGLLYGMGVDKLAASLKVPREEAQRFKLKYFSALPAVKGFLRGATRAAEQRGYVVNWAGRRYQFPKSDFAYKAPNALIQGGCADVVKTAMVQLSEFLTGKKSRMVLQVHDSVLFEIYVTEAGIVEELARIMGAAYPQKLLALECDIKWSKTSWDELEEWRSYVRAEGNDFQEARPSIPGDASEHVV